MVIESGFNPSSYPNCHHQIIFTKFNLKIFYPRLYERKKWLYQRGNAGRIRRAVNEILWNISFANKNVDGKVLLLNKIINNVLSNYIPHEKIFAIIEIRRGW